jgi:hypothetical protein
VKDLRSITDPAAGSEARRQEGPEAAHAFPVWADDYPSASLRDGVGGQAPALFGSWVSFDARGMFPRAVVCLQAPRGLSRDEDAVHSSPQYVGVAGPSVA